MNDLDKILVTSALTIFGSVLVYVIGQLLSKFFIEPMQEQKKSIGEVRFNLSFYSPIIHTPISRDNESSNSAYQAILRNACDLLTKSDAIPCYRRLPRRLVVPIECIEQAAVDLRALSTYLHETGEKAASHIDEVNRRVASIERLLKLRPRK